MKKLAMLRLLTFAILSAPLQAIAQQAPEPTAPPPYYGYGPWHMWGYAGAWHFWWMFPMMLLFFVVLCGAMFLFMRSAYGHGGHGPRWYMPDGPSTDASRSALQILNERFARGEIQKEEYEEKKAALLSGR